MVKVRKDLTGMIFGRLKVIKQAEDHIRPDGKKDAQWLCECSCQPGRTCVVLGSSLNSNRVQSCGCLFDEILINTGHKNKKYNTYDLSGEFGVGWTTNTNREFYFDLEDYDKIKDYCWTEIVHKDRKYCEVRARIIDENCIKTMAQVITGENLIDHKDKDPFNNRRSNLRQSTKQQNAQNNSLRTDNTSGITGVQWHKQNGKWAAYININKVRTYLGLFDDKVDAIKARLLAEATYYKEFAPQKALFGKYNIKAKENEDG